MSTLSSPPRPGPLRLYVGVVLLLAVGAMALEWQWSIVNGSLWGPQREASAVLLVCLFAAELVPVGWVRLATEMKLTLSWVFGFGLVLAGAPFIALIAMASASATADSVARQGLIKTVFNSAQIVVSLAAATAVLVAIGREQALAPGHSPDARWLGAVAVAAVVLFGVNMFLTGVALAMAQSIPIRSILPAAAKVSFGVDGLLISLAPIFVVVAQRSLLLLPLLLLTAAAVARTAQTAVVSERDANEDPLTGLANRRSFVATLDDLVESRLETGFAVAVIDLDGFKQINDSFGHQTGDQVLRIVADRARATLRRQDVVARLGGDEYGIIVAGPLHPLEAGELLDRVRESVEAPFFVGGEHLRVGCSIGMAIAPQHGETRDALVAAADAAMYATKRDRLGVLQYHPSLRPPGTGDLAGVIPLAATPQPARSA